MDKFLPAGDTYDLSIGSPLLSRDEESKPSYAGVVGATLRESPMTPDQAKKTVDLSRQTGLDSGFVARNMADVESMVEEQGLEEMLSDSTGLATWMSTDAIRATMGKADIDNLVETSKLFFSDLGKVGSFASDAAQRRMTYDSMLFQRDVEQKGQPQDIDAERMISMLARQLPKDAQKLAQDYGLSEQFVINTMEQFPVQMEILKSRVAGAGAGAATGALIGAGAGGAGAVPGAWAGAKWGGAVASMYSAYGMEVEGAYSQMVGEGVPSEVASIASRIYGGLASVVEFGDALFDWKLMGADKIAATPGKAAVKMTVRNAIKDFAMAFVKGKGVESLEEMTQQGLQLAVTEAAKMYSNVESGMTMEKAAEEVLTSGLKTFWSLWGAESAAPRFAVNLYDARHGGGKAYLRDKAMLDGQQREQEILNALTDAAQMSKLAQLDYVLYQEAVQAMANGSDVTTVYIPVNGFVEAMGGAESMSEGSAMSDRIDAILGALGLTRDDLSMAIETGDDLVVPVANYAATVAQDREFASLIADHRRLTPDGYTVREMDEYTESVKANLQTVLAEAAAEDAELSQRDAEAKEIYWAVKNMLAMGGVNNELASANAAQMTAFFVAMATRARTTPRALWDAHMPDLRFGEDGKIIQAGEALFPAGEQVSVAGEAQVELNQLGLAVVNIKDEKGKGSIELSDGSYVYWNKTNDPVEVYDDEGNLDLEDGPDYILIDSLYVSPKTRRQGVGRKLLRSALKRISEMNPGMSIRLNADPIADEAVSQDNLVEFYATEGFEADFVDGMSGVPMTWRGPSRQMQEALERDAAGPDVSDPVAGPPTFYQWQNLPEWEEKISNWMREDGRSEDEIREYVDAIRGQMTIFEALGGQIERQVVGAGVAKSSKNKGYALGGPVRSNADQLYRISFDASSQCVKRLSAAATAKMVQERLGRALTLDEQTVLVALYREKGLEAPCLYCYVESGRNKAIRMMETALKNMASAHIPTRLSATRKEGLRAAIDEMAANGLSVEDIDYNFVLNPIAGATEAAVKAKEQYPAIYGFLQSTMSDAKANSVKLYEEYKGELLDLAPEAVETLNGYAGVRFFSSSDFQVEHVIDLMQAMWDLKAMDAKAHAYTKVPLFVDIFGATGLKINTSIFAKLDKDGNVVPDTSQGWEWEEAQKRRELYPDVGAVLVAANDKILQWGLAQDWIDYIIPFHTSQLDAKIVASEGYQDFSSTQNERPIYRGQPAPKIRMHEMGTIEGLTDEQGTRNYLELCMERKVYPVFPAFLFKDFELTDPADPKARAKQTRKAKARWKAMVEKGEIDWDAINMNFFRLKKDYARTDTPFRVVEPQAINAEAARLPLQETLDKGLDAKYAGDAEIADALVGIINGQGKAPSPTIGVDALSANRRGMSVAEATGRRVLHQFLGEKGAASLDEAEEVRTRMDNLDVARKDQIFLERSYQIMMARDVQGGPLGSYSPAYGSSRPLITLFEQADESTFLHESGHMYLEMLKSLATSPSATEEVRAMWEEAKAVLNAQLGGDVVTDMAIPTEAHEIWASSLENWFMKGEAPSMELRGVFAKFSAWLKTIYTMLRSLGKTPAPALEPLFQRMFATDEQIAEVEAWHQRKEDWAELAEEETAKRLREAKAKAHDETVDKRLQTLVKSYLQVLGGSKRFWQEARAAVESLPVYAAMDEAVGDDGLDYETVVALVGQEDASKLRKKRVRLFKKDGGDPSILAAKHGFSDVYAMLGAMLDATPKTKAIKEHYETSIKAMTEKVARGVQEVEAMPGDAEYHNPAQLAVLVAERNLLNNKRLGDKARRDSMIEAEAILAAAREAITRLPVKKAIAAHSFSLAERKAGKLAWRLAMEKDWENAEKAKQQEAMAHAMYIAALEARENVQKGIDKAKQATRSKSMQLQSKEMITDLGIRFGLMSYGGGTVVEQYNRWLEHAVRDSREYPNLTDWEKAALDNGYPVAIADWLKVSQPRTYKELTFEEMGDLLAAIEQIRKVDKRERTALVDGKRIELEKLTEQLEQSAQDAGMTPEKIDRFDDKKKRVDRKVLHAAHAKIEAILLNLDGWKDNGIWWTTFFKPIAEAEDAQTAMLRDVVAKMKALTPMLFKGMKEQYDFFNKRIYIPAIQASMTMNQIVAVGLNMGNLANIDRVMVGEGWNKAQLEAVISKMEKRHWDFCQGVWDYLETFRPASFALEREMSGRSPKAVEPQEVQTPFGVYRGGYYPIVYDPARGDRAAEREQKDLDKQLFGGRNYGAAMTKHGHLKERAKSGTGEHLLLDVNVVSTHLYNTVHDLSHRKAVVEVAKILRNKGVYGVLKKYAGKPVAEQLMPWLQDIANEMQAYSGQNYIDRMAKWARHGTTVMQMGLKATTILVQPMGYANTVAYIGAKYAAIGLAEFHGNPLKSAEKAKFVFSKSEMMQNRAKGFDRDLREATKGLSISDVFTRNVQRCAFSAIGWIQLGVDMPTWLGAYRKGLAEHMGDEEKAVAYADSVVRMTQSSGSVKDLSRVQRGSELYRLMTMFYSSFNALYQLAWRAKRLTHGAKDIPFLAGQALMLWFLPSVLGELVAGRGPEDDEEWEKWMAKTIMMYPAQMIIGLRDLVNGLGPWGYQGTPAETAVAALLKFAKQVVKLLDAEEEVDPERLVKAGVEATGYFFGLPLKQPIITIGNIYDYMTGDTPDFQLRDLLFVKPKDRR